MGLKWREWQEHKSGWYPNEFNEEWDIIMCEQFHFVNNLGEKFDEPFGAFWAIQNIEPNPINPQAISVLLPD